MKDKKSSKYTIEEDEQGYKHYRKNGESHRVDGPAITYRSGATKYFIEGRELSFEQHAKFVTLLLKLKPFSKKPMHRDKSSITKYITAAWNKLMS
ncbi:hypothetical protein N9Z65_00715 [bacterium]|nr:hypothetical protein [bacterium]